MEKIEIFVIDAPWEQRKGGLRKIRKHQGRELDYETISVPGIFGLLERDIFPLAESNHCIFMWTTERYLSECEAEMSKRGYRRHCRMGWNKLNGVAPAFTVRFAHEYLLWFYKEKLLPIARSERGRFTTVLTEKGREHSRKPEVSYRMIEALYPVHRKMDVFSREYRKGWLQYGDQVNHFNIKTNKNL